MGIYSKAFRVFAASLLLSAFCTSTCYSVTPEQIFIWVSRHMHIEYAQNMPEVNFVEKQQLQEIFQQQSQRSLEKWRNDHGESQASSIMADYLDRLKGMYIPETRTIYVGKHLLPCERQAVLAHEVTHYLQDLRDGPVSLNGFGAEDQRIFREMEAYHMASKFKALYCDESDQDNINLALWYSP